MIIVTGANGFIGSALVRYLNTLDIFSIIGIDVVPREERKDPLAHAQYSQFYLYPEALSFLENYPEKNSIKAVFHIGAISSTTETNWSALQEHNIELSKQLYDYCRRFKIPFLYASSAAVYGDGQLGFSDQSDTESFQPLNFYGKSKKEFDLWLQKNATDETPWYGFRFFNVYGPNEYHKDTMASVAYKAFLQIKNSGQLKLFRSHNSNFEDGEQLRDFIYVKDICHWLWQFYQFKPRNGIYNLGFGQANTWLQLARHSFAALEMPEKIEWIDIPSQIRNQYQYFTEADMKKSFAVGIDKPRYNLEQGINDYFRNYLMTAKPYL